MSKSIKEPIVKLGDIADILVGYPIKKEKPLDDTHYTYRVYRGLFNIDTVESYSCHIMLHEQYLTREGDIIISSMRMKDVALIEKEQEGLLVSDHYLILRCNPEKAFSEYIHNELLTDSCCKERRRLCRDTVLSHQKALKYSGMKIRLPSVQKQQELCEFQRSLEKALIEFLEKQKEKRY